MEKKSYKHKSHICIFCKKEVPRTYEHFIRKHSDEDKVREILSTGDKLQRFWGWKKLKQEGDNYYNNKIVHAIGRKRIVKELSETQYSRRIKRYYDCPVCLGRIRTVSKFHHQEKCSKILRKEVTGTVQEKKNLYDNVPENLINSMRKSLYLSEFLNNIFEEKGKNHRKILRTTMADLLELENSLAEKEPERKKPLVCYFRAPFVDSFVSSIKTICSEQKEGENTVLRYPFKALRLCRLIIQLGNFLKVYYSKRDLDQDVTDVSKFINIFEHDSSKFIRRQAIRSIKLKKLKNPPMLPKTTHIDLLIKTLKEETPKLIRQLEEEKDPASWRNLAENVLCRLTIFNRRRGGAVEKISVTDYTREKLNKEAVTEEATFNLSKEDQKFLSNIKILYIIHKCDNKVPIYINKDLQDAMDVLLDYREYGNINTNNNYFFAASKKSVNPISCVRVIEKYRKILPEEVRHLLTATNLRKHGATSAQFLDLKEQDLEDWAFHMGHTIDVHKRYYRQREDTNSILKTGRILTILDQGAVKFYKGKKIEEIPLEYSTNEEESFSCVPSSSTLKKNKDECG